MAVLILSESLGVDDVAYALTTLANDPVSIRFLAWSGFGNRAPGASHPLPEFTTSAGGSGVGRVGM